jgi:hypothetical protein
MVLPMHERSCGSPPSAGDVRMSRGVCLTMNDLTADDYGTILTMNDHGTTDNKQGTNAAKPAFARARSTRRRRT